MKLLVLLFAIAVLAAAAFYGYNVYHKNQQLASFKITPDNQSNRYDIGEGKIPQSGDLCNGTGGTGQIVSVGNSTITIKRKDGINQVIKLTGQTTIRTSAGSGSETDLKTGQRVTVVVDDSETASTVLVCSGTGQETNNGQK